MNRSRSPVGLLVLFATLACGAPAKASCATYDARGSCQVWALSVADLLSDPRQYNQKRVQVSGYISLDQPPLYEEVSDGIYLSRRPVDGDEYKKGFSLRLAVDHPDRAKFKGSSGTVEGTFHADNLGHLQLWSGTISDITLLRASGDLRKK